MTRARLAHARVLARSLRRFQPDWRTVALVVDGSAESDEALALAAPADLALTESDFRAMAARYGATELCAALGPWALELALAAGAEAALLLAAECRAYGELGDVAGLARERGIVLLAEAAAPPGTDAAAHDHLLLREGGIDSSLVAVSAAGRPFLEWWRERLERHCLRQPEKGLWLDRRWLALAPAYFDCALLRDPGLGAVPWELGEWELERAGDGLLLDGAPLRLARYPGLEPERPAATGARGTAIELAHEYAAELVEAGHERLAALPYGLAGVREEPIDPAEPAAKPPPPPVEVLTRGVNLVVGLGRDSVLDELTDGVALALERIGVPLATIGFRPGEEGEPGTLDGLHPRLAPYDTTLVLLSPIDLVGFSFHVDAELFERRRSIGVWVGEETPPPDLAHPLGFLDEVWVASESAARGLATRTALPVRALPFPVGALELPAAAPAAPELPDAYLVASIVDLGSSRSAGALERANPLALVEAFERAFAEEDGAALVVWAVDSERNPLALEQLRLASGRRDVEVRSGPLRPDLRRALLARCDLYASLAHGVDFDLPAAEALALGRPTVLADSAPARELADEGNAFFVRADPRPVPAELAAYWSEPQWAEPDLDDAARALHSARDAAAGEAPSGAPAPERLGPDRLETFLREQLPEAAPEVEPTALERLVAYRAREPEASWDSPSRFGFAGRALRRLLRRALAPYTSRREELDALFVETLLETRHAESQLDRRVAQLEHGRRPKS